MKARILSAIIFDIENPIIHKKKLQKIDFSKKKFFDFFQKKKFRSKIFQEKIYATPNFFFSACSKHQKGKLHEGLTHLTSSDTKQRSIECQGGRNPPPPGLIRVNIYGRFTGSETQSRIP